ncbi:MAG: hypothetical protein QM710_14950 [Flavobacterium sp.]
MANRDSLKIIFSTDKRPTEADFGLLIDSNVNTEDRATDAEALVASNNTKYITPHTARVIVNPLLDTKEPVITGSGSNDDYWSGNKTFKKVREAVLSGLVIPSDTAIAPTDQIIQAFGKLQAQINGIKTNYRLRTQYITTSGHNLANSTSLQKMFNATTNGAFTMTAGKRYRFKCNFGLSNMSSSSSYFSFGFSTVGATFTLRYDAVSVKSDVLGPAEYISSSNMVTQLVTANTNTKGSSNISGIISCSVGGTLVPSVLLSVGAVAAVSANSYFEIEEIGDTSSNSSGSSWT